MSSDKDKAELEVKYIPENNWNGTRYDPRVKKWVRFEDYEALQQENQRLKVENTRLMSEMEEEQNQFSEERALEASLRQMTEENEKLKEQLKMREPDDYEHQP